MKGLLHFGTAEAVQSQDILYTFWPEVLWPQYGPGKGGCCATLEKERPFPTFPGHDGGYL
jgi:hypothetical protein